MGVNRYTNLTPSTYNPLSMNEIMVTPLAMRKQHDDLLAKQEAVRAGLAKVDPHDKYYEEAVRLKKDLESRIDNTAQQLSQEGFNNNMTGQTIALNREYNDLVSPTGKLGQINAHKQQVAQTIKDYEDAAVKNKWTSAETKRYINQALNEHMQETPWDEKGRIAKFKINKEAPIRYDYHKEFGELAKSAGMSTSEFANATSQLLGPDASGYNAQQSKSYAYKHGKNEVQLNKALDMFIMRLSDPNDAMYKSMDYEGLDRKQLLQTLGVQKDVYNVDNQSEEDGYKVDHFGNNVNDGKDDTNSTLFGEDYNTTEVGAKENDISEINRIGTVQKNVLPIDSKDTEYNKNQIRKYNSQKGTTFTYDKIEDPKLKSMYLNGWKKLSSNDGMMIDGVRVKLTKEQIAKGPNDNSNANVISKAIQQNKVTLTSRLLTSNQAINSYGFPGALGKNADYVDKNIRRQIERGGRKLIDPETGTSYTWNDIASEYDLKNVDDLNYHGFISAHNWEKNDNMGSDSKFSPHVVTIPNGKGGYKVLHTTRIASDNVGGNKSRQNDLTKTFRSATVDPGNFVDFESKSDFFKGKQVMYNPKTQEFDERTGEPKAWTIKFKDGRTISTTESNYMNWVSTR